MQYSLGTVAVTNGSATVTGTGTAWLANVSAGDVFAIRGTGVSYIVASVTNNTTLVLSAPYGGTTGTGLGYVISRSFTPIFRIPFPEPRDLEAVTILKGAINAIENLMQAALAPTLIIRTSNYVAVAEDRNKIVKANTGTTSITLPIRTAVPEGWRIRVFNATGSAVSIVRSDSGDKINGSSSTYSLAAGSAMWFHRTDVDNYEIYP